MARFRLDSTTCVHRGQRRFPPSNGAAVGALLSVVTGLWWRRVPSAARMGSGPGSTAGKKNNRELYARAGLFGSRPLIELATEAELFKVSLNGLA